MTDKHSDTPNENPTGSEGIPLSALLGLLASSGSPLKTADGVGPLLEAARNFVDEHGKPDLVTVTDPATGTELLAVVGNDGLKAIPESVFEPFRDNPRFRRGTATMTDLSSFIAHVNRFGDSDTVVFASDSKSSPSLTAVLDYHRADGLEVKSDDGLVGDYVRVAGEFRHGKHRTSFAFPLSDEWKAWNKSNRETMTMVEFATFLEDRVGDIDLPDEGAISERLKRFVTVNGGVSQIADYAKLIELSRGLRVNEESVIEEAQTLQTGETHLRFSVTQTGASVNGAPIVKVPSMFFIAIPVFNKGQFYRIAAALRYRRVGGQLKFWYELHRPDLNFDDAFREALARVGDETPAQVLIGSPEV